MLIKSRIPNNHLLGPTNNLQSTKCKTGSIFLSFMSKVACIMPQVSIEMSLTTPNSFIIFHQTISPIEKSGNATILYAIVIVNSWWNWPGILSKVPSIILPWCRFDVISYKVNDELRSENRKAVILKHDRTIIKFCSVFKVVAVFIHNSRLFELVLNFQYSSWNFGMFDVFVVA